MLRVYLPAKAMTAASLVGSEQAWAAVSHVGDIRMTKMGHPHDFTTLQGSPWYRKK